MHTVILRSRRPGLAWSMDLETVSSVIVTWRLGGLSVGDMPPYKPTVQLHSKLTPPRMSFRDLIRGGNVDARKVT